MIVDLARLDAGARLQADVCIVGAGAAGLALASSLQGSGLAVLLVESGGSARDPAAEALNEGEAKTPYNGLVAGRARGLGGTLQAWPGQCLRLDPADLEPRDWVPYSGWPIEWAELEAYYAPALSFLGLPADAFEHDVFRMFHVAPPELDPERLGPVVSVFSPRPNRAGVVVPSLRRAQDVRVVLRATVTALVPDESGRRIAGVELRSLDGAGAAVSARAVVLCCGGIENPRLLLASGRGGLGNDRDVVGRYFQDHIACRAATVRTDAARHLQTALGVFYRRRLRYHAKLVLPRSHQARLRVLACGATLTSEAPSDSATAAAMRLRRSVRSRSRPERPLRDAGLVLRGVPEVGVAAVRRYARGWSPTPGRTALGMLLVAEQAPDPASRIRLGSQADALGVPQPSVEWRLGDLDHRTLRQTAHVVVEELRRAGLAELEVEPGLERGPWRDHVFDTFHHMGATRMSSDRATGVVDRDCRVHGISNLFVAGSSVFPTSGFANPTLTLVALALRLSDRIRGELAA